MKFIISLLFITTFIPHAFAEDQCADHGYDTTQCNNIAGCYYSTEWNQCEQCRDTEYSNPGDSECTECSDLAFTETSHKIYDSTTPGQPGQFECPWICDSGYYRGGTNNDECQPCPNNASNCTTTGLSYQDVTCTNSYTAVTHPDHTVTCESCTDSHATNDSNGTCICNAGYYGNPVGLNTVCHACPTNSTSVVNGVANAAGATSIDQCKCDQNHPIRSTNATTGAVTCSACPSNATSYTTGTDFEYECKCDANYYGNGYISCDKCPAGTTKSVGGSSGSNGRQAPTTQADCKFSNNTKFCIPSTTRTVDNSGYMCFTPNNVTYLY